METMVLGAKERAATQSRNLLATPEKAAMPVAKDGFTCRPTFRVCDSWLGPYEAELCQLFSSLFTGT
jgi:hypothetical protein